MEKRIDSEYQEICKILLQDKENLLIRGDGRVEWVCEHGCGHTVSVPFKYKDEWAWWSHGCDGCCSKTKPIN